jgi:hypothetical protein
VRYEDIDLTVRHLLWHLDATFPVR